MARALEVLVFPGVFPLQAAAEDSGVTEIEGFEVSELPVVVGGAPGSPIRLLGLLQWRPDALDRGLVWATDTSEFQGLA